MDYYASLKFIKDCSKFGIKLGLERISEILKRLQNPQNFFRAIHIAGTNGKGSTAAMFDAVLRDASYRTGRYTSPHLSSYRERFAVNGEFITKEKLAEIVTEIMPVLEAVKNDGFGDPTEFEVGTVIAFKFFADAQVEIAIIEVGMGGRLDATNILTPVLSVITHIALDHQQYLGNTLREIAFEKAGIIKPGIPLVIGAQNKEIGDYFQEIATLRNAPYIHAGDMIPESVKVSENGTEFTLNTSCFGKIALRLKMIGKHQVLNSLNVIAGISCLQEAGIKVSAQNLENGLWNAFWPSRIEQIKETGSLKLFLDGAHNPDGARALTDTIQSIYPGEQVDFLIGILGNRPLQEIAGIFAEVAGRVIVTTVPDPKSAPAGELTAIFQDLGVSTIAEPDPGKALQLLLNTNNKLAFVTGSLYLTGLIRSLLLKTGD